MPHTIVTTDEPITAQPIASGPIHTLSVLVNNQPGVLMRICAARAPNTKEGCVESQHM